MLYSLQNNVRVFLYFSNTGMIVSPYIFNIWFLFTVHKQVDLIWLQYCPSLLRINTVLEILIFSYFSPTTVTSNAVSHSFPIIF